MLWQRKKRICRKTPPMTGCARRSWKNPARAYLFYGEESYLRQTNAAERRSG